MSKPQSGARSTPIAIAAFVVPGAVVVFGWIAADISWGLIIIPMLMLAAVAGYAFVLARRGQ